MKKIVIYGFGGHSRILYDIFLYDKDGRVKSSKSAIERDTRTNVPYARVLS